jgi:hypothetical protein
MTKTINNLKVCPVCNKPITGFYKLINFIDTGATYFHPQCFNLNHPFANSKFPTFQAVPMTDNQVKQAEANYLESWSD